MFSLKRLFCLNMQKVLTTEAPIPAGHYSQAIVFNGIVFVAGQLPLDPKTGVLVKGGIEDQVRQTIQNVQAILQASKSDLHMILRATIYIPDIKFWPQVNQMYAELLGEHKPARAVIPCGELHFGALLEMEVIAACIEC